MIRLIENKLKCIRSLPAPPCISVRGCEPYSTSYSYRFSGLPNPLSDFALEAGEALLRVRTGSNMRFFTGMLDPPVSSSVLHKCFALIRVGIARLKGDPRAALHAPIKTERVDDGFPLHSDLFLTDRLWVVFDDVPKGKSGKSLLLPRHSLDDAIKSKPLMPSVTRRKLRAFLRGRIGGDSFDESFDVIYSSDEPWNAPLTQAMKKNCWKIKLYRGEGYLVNDRQWLHGRTAVKGRVSSARFRRLVYGTVATGR